MNEETKLELLRSRNITLAELQGIPTWEPPLPLDKEGSLPAFPVACLPDSLGNYAAAVAEDLQVAVDMPGICALTAAAVCVQRKFKIAGSGSHREPLNLYSTIVARP